MIWFTSSFCYLFFCSENKISEQLNFCKYYVLFNIYFWVFFFICYFIYIEKKIKNNIIMYILLLFFSQEPCRSTTTSYNRNIQGLDLLSPILTILLYRLLFVFQVNKMWVIDLIARSIEMWVIDYYSFFMWTKYELKIIIRFSCEQNMGHRFW